MFQLPDMPNIGNIRLGRGSSQEPNSSANTDSDLKDSKDASQEPPNTNDNPPPNAANSKSGDQSEKGSDKKDTNDTPDQNTHNTVPSSPAAGSPTTPGGIWERRRHPGLPNAMGLKPLPTNAKPKSKPKTKGKLKNNKVDQGQPHENGDIV